MGTVYEADHLESGRRVALKVLGHRLDSPEAKQRFLREGRLAASVNHPNSVYVFGTEEIAGVPVIAMELVPGGTLEERVLREGPLPVGEAVDAILQVIDGLEAAEAGGVLHRDVKAANCFVDREGTVKVGDFGLSISTSLRGDSNVTGDGTFLGTPAFSSPEQLRGDELDVRSDIYAVGVTLYYLLTGRMPFKADNLVRLIATVLEHPPKSPAELRPDIPKGLARAVLRCLQKQPAARFRTYDELRQALAPFSSAAPTPAALGLRLGAGIVDYLLWRLGRRLPHAGMRWIGDFERMSNPDYFGSLEHNLLGALIVPAARALLRRAGRPLGSFAGQGDLWSPCGESKAERRGRAEGIGPRRGLRRVPAIGDPGLRRADRDRGHLRAADVAAATAWILLVRDVGTDVLHGPAAERIRRIPGSGEQYPGRVEVGLPDPAGVAQRRGAAGGDRGNADRRTVSRAEQPGQERRSGIAVGLRHPAVAEGLDPHVA